MLESFSCGFSPIVGENGVHNTNAMFAQAVQVLRDFLDFFLRLGFLLHPRSDRAPHTWWLGSSPHPTMAKVPAISFTNCLNVIISTC